MILLIVHEYVNLTVKNIFLYIYIESNYFMHNVKREILFTY